MATKVSKAAKAAEKTKELNKRLKEAVRAERKAAKVVDAALAKQKVAIRRVDQINAKLAALMPPAAVSVAVPEPVADSQPIGEMPVTLSVPG